MFEPATFPRVFGLAPGVDFPRALVSGIISRMSDRPPEAMARVQLIVNTRRMHRRLTALFAEQGAMLLPQLCLITDLDGLAPGTMLPPAVSPLRRRLDLIALVSKLIEKEEGIAPRASLYDLTDSVARLMDEMQGEGVSAADIALMDVRDQSGHWQRAQQFFQIAQEYVDRMDGPPEAEVRQRQLVDLLAHRWQQSPPDHPVIVAGSTGSRGTTLRLMKAVAQLPQGALVLPGFDFEMPAAIWSQLNNEMMSEDHPQYRFFRLMQTLDISRGQISSWDDNPPPSRARNALVSLSLRPAPFTHAWMTEGTQLTDIESATNKITMLRAPTPRTEALAIALRLRAAVESGQTAALITPDRMLTRQVTAALDQWGILPDDSAGTPLHLSPPGRLLRHVATLMHRRLDAEALLTLLKHPLTHIGQGRNTHILNTQKLELAVRDEGLPYPDNAGLMRLMTRATKHASDAGEILSWVAWVGRTIAGQCSAEERPLAEWVTRHIALAEAIAEGETDTKSGALWLRAAGEEARAVMTNLADHAAHGGTMTALAYADLLNALLSDATVRERDAPRSDVMIWGTLEARVQGADLVILGGLNDGTWPETPTPDPWMNRAMRHKAGLLLPERRIGLSAHDYQQAIGAPEVWLTRAIRSDDAETVASRWINRLSNLLDGLSMQGGPDALSAMIARGDMWLAKVAAFEAGENAPAAPRPSPRPPIQARPRKLSVTEIKTLIRDPYAIYGKHVLRLRRLGDLVQGPDAALRGTLIHSVMETFIHDIVRDPTLLDRNHLMDVTRAVLSEHAPWPAARTMWLAKVSRVADWFVERERVRQTYAKPIAFEDRAKGSLAWSDIGFTLTAKADRIDRTESGDIMIFDYKTGRISTPAQQLQFDKQLLLMAAMVERGAFEGLEPAHVAAAIYIGLGSAPKEVAAPLDEEPPSAVLDKMHSLAASYLSLTQGFTARRAVELTDFAGDYDQLARFGEWDATTPATPEDLT